MSRRFPLEAKEQDYILGHTSINDAVSLTLFTILLSSLSFCQPTTSLLELDLMVYPLL